MTFNTSANFDLNTATVQQFSAVGRSAVNTALAARWKAGLGLVSGSAARWSGLVGIDLRQAQRWAGLAGVQRLHAQRWQGSVLINTASAQHWQLCGGVGSQAAQRWLVCSAVGSQVAQRWLVLGAVSLSSGSRWSVMPGVVQSSGVRWRICAAILDGQSVYILPPVVVPDVPVVVVPIVITKRGLYLVTNSVSVVRLPDRKKIECLSVNLSTDAGSWGWSCSVNIEPEAWAYLLPAPSEGIEIEITLNNAEVFVFVVRSLKKSRTFGKDSITLNGVSRAVWLGDPFAPVVNRLNTSAMTAQQLVNAALLAAPYAGPTGFTLDWALTDWLVPSGAFGHTGTALQYISEIAAAVGGTVSAHRNAWELRLEPLFPAKSWEFNAQSPYLVLPVDVVYSDGLEWDDYQAVNNVALTGGAIGGIIDNATRSGTAGNKSLQPINHDLFTNVIATRQRAIAELSKSGRKYMQKISLPLVDGVGVIDANKFVEIDDGSGDVWLTRGVSVACQFPVITQSVSLERWVNE